MHNCQSRGAVGVILFSDPNDVAVRGTDPEDVYPNSIFLPGSGIQRGSTYIGEGDPLSQLYPSVENAYRMRPEDVPGQKQLGILTCIDQSRNLSIVTFGCCDKFHIVKVGTYVICFIVRGCMKSASCPLLVRGASSRNFFLDSSV